jgi:3-methylcrotonyl-CoA carboxylase beta subunit
MGSCTAGGAYVPAMSDETIIVREQGTIFLGGPPLVKAATGEVVDAEGSRRRRRAHARVGRRRPLRRERRTCARNRARIVAHLNRAKPAEIATCKHRASRLSIPTRSTASCRADTRTPTTCARSSPASSTAREFDEFKARYGTTIVTGFAHIHGYPVGIVANNGILFSESALKGAHFIELCNQRNIRWSSCRTSPASWSAEIRERRHRQGRRQDGHRRRHRARAQVHRRHRRQLRRRQLRHVRPRLQPRFLWMWPNARIS